VLLCGLLVSGCAFGTRSALLTYQVSGTPHAARNITLAVSDFRDDRNDKRDVGGVRNTWGMKTAKVVAKNDVAQWVRQALVDELTQQGYTVSSAPASLAVGGKVLEVYCDSYMTYEGKVLLAVELRRDGAVLLDKTYAGKGGGMNWAATSKGYAKALQEALATALYDVVSDINRTLAEQPTARR